MRTKIVVLSGILSGLIYLMGCDDAIDKIGMGIQPDGDKVIVFDDSLDITGETIKDPVLYAKSIYGLLGNFYDEDYGELTAGYICQFFPTEGFGTQANMDSIVTDMNGIPRIDSIQLKILYTTYAGDSLSPMEVSVYPVNKPIPQDYYTNLDPAGYCDMNVVLGKQAYTARDLTISDSLNLANISNNNYKLVSVTLPRELGQRFFDEYTKANHGAYASPEAMIEFFPGLYVKSTFGSGCMLNVEKTGIYIYYTRKYETTNDTTLEIHTNYRVQASVLDVTKEVIQLNQYTGSNEEKLLNPGDNMYLKTPAGIFAQVTIPMAEIKAKIGDRKFSNVRLSIPAEVRQEEWEYALPFPGMGTKSNIAMSRSKLLLIEADSATIKTFFEEKKYADGKTSFYTTFDKATYSYTFDNISNVVQNAIDRGDTTDLVLRLIPVQVGYYEYTGSYYNPTSLIDYNTTHYLAPSAVTLKKNNLKIQIIAADLNR